MSESSARRRRLLRWLAAHWSDLVFGVLALLLCAWIASDAFGARVGTVSQTGDYWEHSATLRALIDDPWHPRNPHLVSDARSPRFIPTFILAALVARAAGLDALGAMGVASCLNLLGLCFGIFWFFRSYFRDTRASLYGFVVMFTSWYEAWNFSNVYQLKILFSVVGYPSTAALGFCLIGFAITLRALRRSPTPAWLGAVALIWALVMITHPLTAMLGFAGAFLLAATDPRIAWRTRVRVGAAIFAGALLSLLWPYFSVRGVLSGGSHDEVSALVRELAGTADPEPSGRLHTFYRTNGLVRSLGLALAGLPICVYLMLRRRHWFISLGALAMLLPFIVNAYRPLPLGHRFILLAVFFLQTALVWFLLKLTRGAPEAWRRITRGKLAIVSSLFVALALLVPSYWNVTAALGHLGYSERRERGGESINVRYGRRVAELAGARAVVLADAKNSWPIPTFGPKVLLLLHANPLVSDEAEREARVAEFFRPSTPAGTRLAIIQRYGVTHVLVKRAAGRRTEGFLPPHGRGQVVPGGYLLYALDPAG